MSSSTHPTENAEALFREEVREWLEASRPREPRPQNSFEAERQYDLEWQKIQYEGGWAGLSWPREYGGRGATLLEQLVWNEEYGRAWAPDLIMIAVGISLVGPVLISKGLPWQRERFLQRIDLHLVQNDAFEHRVPQPERGVEPVEGTGVPGP